MRKAILAIRTLGDPCLREPSMALEEVGPSERLLIKAMVETMYEADGVGLAAPQVGINRQIVVIDIGNGPILMINPEIISRKGAKEIEEGCLSVPTAAVKVKRAENVVVRFIDEQNQQQEMECSGLMARAVQHECDHLQGKLIVDYANEAERQKIKSSFPNEEF